MIHPLGSWFVNFYLVEEDGAVTVVDAGLPGYRSTLEPGLQQAGRSLDDVRAIVLTHADPDHLGFAAALQQERSLPVYVHAGDAQRTREGKQKQAEGSPLSMLGLVTHAHGRRVIGHMLRNRGLSSAPIPEVIEFADGDVLPVPGALRAVHTPGHTDGHSVFVVEADDALLIGDALSNQDLFTGEPGPRLTAPAATTDVTAAIASLDRLLTLPQRNLYYGHGAPTRDGTAAAVAAARSRL